MPSPTSRTLPTSRLSTCDRYCSISDCSTETISSALNLMRASLDQLLPQGVQARADGQVDQTVADLKLDAADQVGVDGLDQDGLKVKPLLGQLTDFDPLLIVEGHRRSDDDADS